MLAENRLDGELLAAGLLERGARFDERTGGECSGEQGHELVDVDGLGEVFRRAGFQRVDRRREVAVSRQDEDGKMRIGAAQPPRHLHAV